MKLRNAWLEDAVTLDGDEIVKLSIELGDNDSVPRATLLAKIHTDTKQDAHAGDMRVKRYTAKALAKAPAGFYWFLRRDAWNVGYLRVSAGQKHFCCCLPEIFGPGAFGLDHELLQSALFEGPLKEPEK